MASPAVPIAAAAAVLILTALGKKPAATARRPNGDAATTDPDTPTTGRAARLPWMVESAATLGYQNEINAFLVPAGYQPITADGVLGPDTCAAGRFAASELGRPELAPATQGADCQSFGDNPTRATGSPDDATSPAAAADAFNRALATGDPGLMRQVARALRSGGFANFADSLETIADQLSTELGTGLADAAADAATGAQVATGASGTV